MRVDGPRGRLYDAHKTLRLKWDEAKTVWRDTAQKQFEEDHWEELDQAVLEMMRSIDRLEQIFSEMRTQCEGRGTAL